MHSYVVGHAGVTYHSNLLICIAMGGRVKLA